MAHVQGLWGVESTLAVIGTGGPVNRSNVITSSGPITPMERVDISSGPIAARERVDIPQVDQPLQGRGHIYLKRTNRTKGEGKHSSSGQIAPRERVDTPQVDQSHQGREHIFLKWTKHTKGLMAVWSPMSK
eukprot:1039422-Prorocentrum_minimum.AAC.2